MGTRRKSHAHSLSMHGCIYIYTHEEGEGVTFPVRRQQPLYDGFVHLCVLQRVASRRVMKLGNEAHVHQSQHSGP